MSFSFQNMFLNIGTGVSQLFLSRNMTMLGTKLDNMSAQDIHSIIMYYYVKNNEKHIGEIIRGKNMYCDTFAKLTEKYMYFVEHVTDRINNQLNNRFDRQHNNRTNDQINDTINDTNNVTINDNVCRNIIDVNYSGIFDILLEKETRPICVFFDIVQTDKSLYEIMQPFVEMCINNNLNKTQSFEQHISMAFMPFMKSVHICYKKLMEQNSEVYNTSSLMKILEIFNKSSGTLCDMIDEHNKVNK